MRVCIDAGHGGKDSGAVGTKEVEKRINLQVAERVAYALENAGISVTMTREADTYITLANRCNVANSANADIFVSIHTNSTDKGKPGWQNAKGVETWVYVNEGNTQKLAQAVHNNLSVGRIDRGIKENGFAVLTGTKMPSILIELGFISNEGEQSYMMANIDYMAKCISDGIIAYLGIKKPVDSNVVSAWAIDAWEQCKELGILDGTRPKDSITREEAAVIVSRLLKITGVM